MKFSLVSRFVQRKSVLTKSLICAPVAAVGLSMVIGLTWADSVPVHAPPLGTDETAFVFMGTCDHGEKYRIVAYTQIFEGQPASMYDFEGPAGSGTIRSNTTPRTLAVRVCRKMAEIIDDH